MYGGKHEDNFDSVYHSRNPLIRVSNGSGVVRGGWVLQYSLTLLINVDPRRKEGNQMRQSPKKGRLYSNSQGVGDTHTRNVESISCTHGRSGRETEEREERGS